MSESWRPVKGLWTAVSHVDFCEHHEEISIPLREDISNQRRSRHGKGGLIWPLTEAKRV
jgi:hypothetical protein